ncbi:MAG: hypothetical protein FWE80_10050, partial [Oscillospiraceae bacterium]|nr:hypothetical protein [Oscillospiraceae bacterium]
METTPKTILKGTIGRVISVLITLFLLFSVVCLGLVTYTVTVGGSQADATIFGFKPALIASDEMEGGLRKGGLIILKKVDPSAIFRGNIIAFVTEQGDLMIRRVEDIQERYGERSFVTSSDANGPDDFLVSSGEFRYKGFYVLNWVAAMRQDLQTAGGIIKWFGLPVLLFGGGFVVLIIRRQRQKKRTGGYQPGYLPGPADTGSSWDTGIGLTEELTAFGLTEDLTGLSPTEELAGPPPTEELTGPPPAVELPGLSPAEPKPVRTTGSILLAILTFTGITACALYALLAVFAWIILTVPPPDAFVFGYRPMITSEQEMQPLIQPHALLLIRKIEKIEQLRSGDYITYYRMDDDNIKRA